MADDRVDFSGNAQQITSANDGDIGNLGDVSAYYPGFFALQFIDGKEGGLPSFQGSLTIVAQPRKAADVVSTGTLFIVPWIPITYRYWILNGVALDPTALNNYAPLGVDGLPVPITTTSYLEVPASGLTVGVQVKCTGGSGWLYRLPLIAPTS